MKETLTVMSYNILCDTKNEERIPHVMKIIKDVMPDTLGLQEMTPYWEPVMKEGLGDRYTMVGIDRGGGDDGESVNLFFRNDIFDLVDTGDLWLTDTPNEVSKYEDSCCYRILTYAKLRRKSDGKLLLHVNTHLDFTTPEVICRQAEVLVAETDRLSCENVIITGDFNITKETKMGDIMTSHGYVECVDAAPDAEHFESFADLGLIDHCYVKGEIKPLKYYTDHTRYSDTDPSDHCPVIVKYEL